MTGVFQTSSSTNQTKQEADIAANQKQSIAEDETKTPAGDEKVPDVTPPYNPPSNADGIDISAKQSSTEVVVFTKLEGYADGSCQLKVTNGGRSTSQSAPVVFQREFSTCAGFTVPIDSLGTGKWNIELSVTAGSETNTKSIDFEVN